MKLIDMLVEEGLNGWKWPDGTIAITQDKDKAINQYATADGLETNEHGTWKYSASRQTHLRLSHEELCLASDWDTAIVTREQYETALAAKNEGWIEWGGGACPVEEGTLVDVKYRDGDDFPDALGVPALSGYGTGSAFWELDGYNNDIIAYRLHKPQEAEQAKSELNDCIEQDAATEWSGEGAIPPVGCVCERSWAGDEWQSCKILFESGQIVVVKLKESGMEDAYNIGDVIFRPIRTEAERKRDAVVEQMIKIATIYTTKSLSLDLALNSIYNAIAAGEITGVKLED